jgi:acyl-CoA thioesterase-1
MRLPFAFVAALLWACSRVEESRETGLTPESLARPVGSSEAVEQGELEVPADAPLVVFLGDSITAGLHLEPEQAFPAVVQRELVAAGVPFRLVNAGVSGDTTAGGLARVDWLLKQAPDVVVVELGGNDGLRGQPVAAVEERLRAIVTRAREAGARVVLLGVQLPPSLGAEYVAEFEALYPRLAEEQGCVLVPRVFDGVGGVEGMMLEDGIHPSAAGHRKVAQVVAPALRSLLEALREE